jgi:hypothetical protein
MINKNNNMLLGLIIISIFYTTCSATCISCSIESFKSYNNEDVDNKKSLHSSIVLKSLLLHKQKNRIQSLTKIKGGHISSSLLHDDIIHHSSSQFNLSLSAIKILLQVRRFNYYDYDDDSDIDDNDDDGLSTYCFHNYIIILSYGYILTYDNYHHIIFNYY